METPDFRNVDHWRRKPLLSKSADMKTLFYKGEYFEALHFLIVLKFHIFKECGDEGVSAFLTVGVCTDFSRVNSICCVTFQKFEG